MKIGVGVITCKRQDFFEKCLHSILRLPKSHEFEIVVVNDGPGYSIQSYAGANHVIQHQENQGVGISKNDALKHLLSKGCEHLFLIEDDIIVKEVDVFNVYIHTAKFSGIQHLMFGYHGPANKNQFHQPAPRLKIMYHPYPFGIALNQHCVGAFCYYTRECLETVGLNDEKFKNAFEHVEHTYRLHKAGFTTPYWWFADVHNSYELLTELACSEVSSVIRPRDDWQQNIQQAAQYFIEKHGVSPVAVPDTHHEHVLAFLREKVKSSK